MPKTMMYGVLIASPSGINHRNAAAFRNRSAAASRTELSVTGPKSARLVPLQCRHQLTFRSLACRARLSHTQKPLRYACRHGGIAAYKSCELVRLLKKAGADVRVIMTEAAGALCDTLNL